jgi:DNA ligase 4
MATTVASKVPFYQLSVLLDKISDTDGKDRKKKHLKDFIDEWRAFHSKLHKADGDVVGCL